MRVRLTIVLALLAAVLPGGCASFLQPPFPDKDVTAETPAPKPAADEAKCAPTLRFAALCFEDQGHPICLDAEKIRKAFHDHGYPARITYASSGGTKRSFEQVMDAIRDAMKDATNFCKCPLDQLVIYTTSHGTCGSLHFNGDPDQDVSLGEFARKVAEEVGTADAKKVYLMVTACESGGLFNSGTFPVPLKGIHLLASSPADASTQPIYTKAMLEALGKSETWFDLVKKTKENTAKTGQPQPKNGDIASACRIRVRVKSVKYAGDRLGDEAETSVTMPSRWRTTTKFGEESSGALIHEALWDAGSELEVKVFAGSNGVNGSANLKKKYGCPEKQTETLTVTLKNGAATATVTVVVEVETEAL